MQVPHSQKYGGRDVNGGSVDNMEESLRTTRGDDPREEHCKMGETC